MQEFLKFCDTLKAHGVKYRRNDNDVPPIVRAQGVSGGHRFSVIFGYGTYGYESGLLEVMTDHSEPTGWLTADEAVEYINKRGGKI